MIRLLASLCLVVMLGCVAPAGRPTDNPPTDSPSTDSPPTDSPPKSPSAATNSPPATIAPPSAEPTVQPGEEDPRPPDALLVLPDGSAQPGALGSYAYGGAAADAPWLPARALAAIDIPAGARLGLRLAGPQRFVSWGARYAAAEDEEADMISPLASGGDGHTPLDAAEFGALPPGDWVLMVQVHFADDLGDAAYYWHLVVP